MFVLRGRRRLGAMLLASLGVVAAAALAAPAAAEQSPTAADCLATGTALQNGSFENPALPGINVHFLPADGGLPGWQTTDTQFEVWSGGFNAVPAAAGSQHVELNANLASTLYQTVATTPGTVVAWQFAHRARLMSGSPGSAQDTMDLLIGPDYAGAVSQGQFTDDDVDWAYHSGLYAVPPGQTSTIFAFQAVSSSSGDASAGNFLDDISFSTAPCLVVDTAIVDAGGGSVQRGDVLTITTTARNDGHSTASDVRLSAAVPPQTTYLPGTLVVQGSSVTDAAGDDHGEIVGSALSWRVGSGAGPVVGGSLLTGASATVSFQVVVDPGATGTIESTSTTDAVWAGAGPVAPATSGTAVAVLAVADLSTTKTVAAANLEATIAGGPLAYEIGTANDGPDEAVDVVITDVLPSALLAPLATADPSAPGASCSVVAGQAICTYPVLPAGATATTRITGILDPATAPGTAVANTAVSLARTEDPDLANNTASVSTDPTTAVADLAATIRYGAGPADASSVPARVTLAPGDALRLTAQVVNTGPSTSPASTVVIVLDPAGRNWAVATSAPASCLTFGARIMCALGPLAAGDAVSLEIGGVLGAAAPAGDADLISSALVTGSVVPDPQPANDFAQAVQPVRVLAVADLGTTVVLTTPVITGQPVSYLVSTVNNGPSNAIGLVVTAVVPAGVAEPVGIPDPAIAGGSCVTQVRTVICTYPVVRPGVAVRTTVAGQAEAGLTLEVALTLRASSRSATPDPYPGNDSALATATTAAVADAAELAATGADPRSAATLGVGGLALGALVTASAALGGSDRRHKREPHISDAR